MSTEYETIINTVVRPVDASLSTIAYTSLSVTTNLETAALSRSGLAVSTFAGVITTSLTPGAITSSFTPSSPTSPSTSGSRSQGLTTGAAAGVGVGATLGVLLIVALVGWIFWRRRRRAKATITGTRSKVDDPFGDGAVQPVMEKDGEERFEAGNTRQVAEAPGERDHVEAGGAEVAELDAAEKPAPVEDKEKT